MSRNHPPCTPRTAIPPQVLQRRLALCSGPLWRRCGRVCGWIAHGEENFTIQQIGSFARKSRHHPAKIKISDIHFPVVLPQYGRVARTRGTATVALVGSMRPIANNLVKLAIARWAAVWEPSGNPGQTPSSIGLCDDRSALLVPCVGTCRQRPDTPDGLRGVFYIIGIA